MKARLAALLQAPARSAAILIAAGGVVSLSGWLLGVRWLQAVVPGTAPLNRGSALCFLLLGLAQWWVRPAENDAWQRIAGIARVIPALAVALIAALRIAESFGNAAVVSGAETALSPAREFFAGMAPNTAICFLMLGMGLAVFDARTGRRLEYSQLLFLGEAVLALAAFLARSFELTSMVRPGAYLSMSFNSSMGLLILTAGFLMERFQGGLLEVIHTESAGGMMARRFLPTAIIVPPLLGYLCWRGQTAGLYSEDARRLLFIMSNVVVFGVLILRTAHFLHVADRERQHAQTALKQTNEMLTDWVRELEARNKETLLLNEMGDRLQTCLTTEEACGVITKSALSLFPNDSGALFVTNPSKNLVEVMAVWGGYAPGEPVFAPEDCWALRSGRLYRVDDPAKTPLCAHVRSGAENGYLCVPMVAQGEAVGILHLEMGAATPGGRPAMTDAKNRLAISVADHLALALSSLRLRETLHIQSIRDPLTGLFNRRYMEESLEREIRRADRKQRPLAALMLDLDHFKRYNDTLGHAAGDAMLRAIGSFLQTRMRKDDIVCRYGGEEFTIIMPESSLAIAKQRAERLRLQGKELDISLNGQFLGSVTFSVGIACFPDHGTTGEQLLRAADLALYRAKAAGRDCVMAADIPTESAAH
jgi:diguanylate cyclase (GGDEF)-like protein